MFTIHVGVASAAFREWLHFFKAPFSGEFVEFERDTNQLIMEMEMEEMWSEPSPRRDPPTLLRNNSTTVLAIALIVIAIVMFAYIL
ncbi:hypothetical protein NECAME_12215 [Necator americanus]|uniref:Uncharacterized protein n=1 Tax=Necator americanus TaxID=51031 RepID=W2T3X0_NECAM|nr:hypothetical protein NECAME_12215 [Necator americanus]ETN75667.1 hypothetical protein NECAME_12215 [Necator americanus]